MNNDKAKSDILDWCSQSVECLARRKVIDLVGTLDAAQSSPETERAEVVRLLRTANVTINEQWEGSTGYISESEAGRLADAIAALSAGHAPTPAGQRWMRVSDAEPWLQEFAKHCEISDDRCGYIEYGGTGRDGRPFVLCLEGPFSKKYDRWFVLPSVDEPAVADTSTDREGK